MSTITLPERFDFNYHSTFTGAYPKLLENSESRTLVLDFSRVTYLDSSALGMMVLVNKKAKAAGKEVVISNAKGPALEILKVANFDQKFKLQ